MNQYSGVEICLVLGSEYFLEVQSSTGIHIANQFN